MEKGVGEQTLFILSNVFMENNEKKSWNINSMDTVITVPHHTITWNKLVMLKVSLLEWKLLKNMIPSKYNIAKHDITKNIR